MQITRDDDFGGAVLNCAVRYALGRASYMPGLVMDEIRPMLPDCNDKTLHVFVQDISEWLAMNKRAESFVSDNYWNEWERFREDVMRELERRSEE